MRKNYWTLFYWTLLISWLTGVALFMARISGGFLTNYLSDFAFPAWFYIYIRGLSRTDRRLPQLVIFKDWFGITSTRALLSILTVGIISEAKTFYWPTGLITGTFDIYDIVAYSLGLSICYYFDIRQNKKESRVERDSSVR
jgi:hypothetical protein